MTAETRQPARDEISLTEEERIQVDLRYSEMKRSGELEARRLHQAHMAELNGYWS